ncbi:MAG TPA: MATE family efflux transporter [Acidimicrobiales bacterium]|nr:MATE family efflux transporter [Acidimicrobiales bacterium]
MTRLDREILGLAVPAFFTLIAEPLYVLADTAVVGHLGTPQLAGVAAASLVLVTGYSLCIFLAFGTTAAVARLLGAGEHRAAAHAAVQALWLGLVIGVPLALLGFAFTEPLLALVGVEGAARVFAHLYFRISLLGVPALLVSLASVGYLRGSKRVWIPLAVAVVSNAVNLTLEIVLIYGLGYGVGASAAATVFVQLAAAAVYAVVVVRAAVRRGAGLRPDHHAIRAAGSDGWLLFLRTLSLRGAFFILTAATARLGEVELAAQQIAMQIWTLLALSLDSLEVASQTLVGQALGGGSAGRAQLAARRTLRWGTGVGCAAALLTLAFHSVVPHIFTDDPAVISLASYLLVWVAITQPLGGPAFVLDGILVGSGDLRFLAAAMAGISMIVIAGEPIVLWLGGGIGWLWAVFTAFMAARVVVLGRRAASNRWAVTGATRR